MNGRREREGGDVRPWVMERHIHSPYCTQGSLLVRPKGATVPGIGVVVNRLRWWYICPMLSLSSMATTHGTVPHMHWYEWGAYDWRRDIDHVWGHPDTNKYHTHLPPPPFLSLLLPLWPIPAPVFRPSTCIAMLFIESVASCFFSHVLSRIKNCLLDRCDLSLLVWQMQTHAQSGDLMIMMMMKLTMVAPCWRGVGFRF